MPTEDEIAAEQQAVARVRDLVEQLATEVETSRLWNWGDGYGSWVTHLLHDAFARHGLTGRPPAVKRTRPHPAAQIPAELRLRVYQRDGFECLACGVHDSLTIDHIIPRSKGGTDAESNLQTLCRSCNARKGARLP